MKEAKQTALIPARLASVHAENKQYLASLNSKCLMKAWFPVKWTSFSFDAERMNWKFNSKYPFVEKIISSH